MKKKLILLPVLMFALAACGKSSPEPFVDTNVWRVVGDFGTSNWNEKNDDYKMVKDADKNEYTFVGLDLYVDNEWSLAKNGDWPGQIGFDSPATYVAIVDSGNTMAIGGGPATKNFKVVTAGKYTLKLETVETGPYTLTITRTGDATTPPVTEVDSESWYLIGSMSNDWDVTNTDYPLAYDAALESYVGVYELEANTKFKIKSPTDETWAYARGYGNVDVPTPAPTWLANDDGNIKVTETGLYTVRFVWIASVGSTVKGSIIITQSESFEVPAAHILGTKVVGDPVAVDEVEVLGNTDKYLFLANKDGTLLVNYFNIDQEDQGPWLALEIGEHISVTGEVILGGGLATGARVVAAATFAKVPTSFFITGFEVADEFDLDVDTLGEINTALTPVETRGLYYKFTNVQFFNKNSNNWSYFLTATSGVPRVGVYYSVVPDSVKTMATDPNVKYTVYGVFVGSRPANDLDRISFLVEIVEQTAPATPAS